MCMTNNDANFEAIGFHLLLATLASCIMNAFVLFLAHYPFNKDLVPSTWAETGHCKRTLKEVVHAH